MRILKRVDKKLCFRVLKHTVIVTTIILLAIYYLTTTETSISSLERQKVEAEKRIENLLIKSDSMYLIIDSLQNEVIKRDGVIIGIEDKIDSLEEAQIKARERYDEEVNNVHIDSTDYNVKSVRSELNKLRRLYKLK